MPPDLVIFDCDGVLVDSEWVASRVVAAALTAIGWAMATAEAQELFLGMSIADMMPLIEARLGHGVPAGWQDGLVTDLREALAAEATLIPGARELLLGVTAMGLKWRVASNSSLDEMAVKFRRCGIADLVGARAHSAGEEIAKGGRPKPAPDVFLAAARAEGVAPGRCVVLEDSAVGVRGAVAAGMRVYGFDPHGQGVHLLAAGARAVLHDLSEFTGVLK